MALAAKLQMRQSQALVMTPQLMQSIRLLQFTHLELERFIDDEIERNPLLDRAEPENTTFAADPAPGGEPTAAGTDEAGTDEAGIDEAGIDEDWLAETETAWSAETISEKLDTTLENVFPDDPGASERLSPDLTAQWKSVGNAGGNGDEGFNLEDIAASAITLRDHVDEQIAFAFSDAADRIVARDLADDLDERGYCRADTDEVAARLGLEDSVVAAVLAKCQTFEPVGLFARDLSECLGLQLAARDRLDPAMQALLGRLDLLAKRDFQTLRRICGVDDEDLLDMMAEIRALDPRPGMAFTSGVADTIVADVIVRRAGDGSWAVELNPETLPRVLVDQVYFARIQAKTKDPAEKEFLSECLQNANWLTRSLDQRAKTILKVSAEIVRQQDAFLVHGVRHLRPLNLKTVAEAIGMHESTVSRVTANKYILTARGVFELRYFFTAAIQSAGGGDAHSSEAVRDQIRELIDDERPADILSDDAIVDILRKNGVDIARRTVAKYREGMSIASSVQRRREKRAMAMAGR